MNEDFLDLLRAFIAHEVRYLVVGAYALGVHGRDDFSTPGVAFQMGLPPVRIDVLTTQDLGDVESLGE